jgi:acetyl-CoA acyltransferase
VPFLKTPPDLVCTQYWRAVLAGLPVTSVGGITVNRFCASGCLLCRMAADRIHVGEAGRVRLAWVVSIWYTCRAIHHHCRPPCFFPNDENISIAYGMGLTAERVARQWKVSRAAQDEFAYASAHDVKAQQAGEFTNEITPVGVTDRTANLKPASPAHPTTRTVVDEGARPNTTVEGLARAQNVAPVAQSLQTAH